MMLSYQVIAIADRLYGCTLRSLQPVVDGHPSDVIRSEAQMLLNRAARMSEEAADISDICHGIAHLMSDIGSFRDDVQAFLNRL